ncbi:hypothetical protein [Burkholderia cepacia]|uniref:hypothetical protein n=1 Tax=Burkholderia cepacia TaxID=292 RepID=UPI002FDF80F7
MTTENSRADALTIIEDARDGNWYEFAVNGHHGLIRVVARMEDDDLDYPLGKKVRDFLLAASPVEQPATAPIVSAPADERAAFDLTDMEWLKVFERVSASIPNVFGSYVKASAAFAREAIRLAEEARVASANETGAQGLEAAARRDDVNAGWALYERLHALMPDWYPDAWEDLLPKYQRAYTDAAATRSPAMATEAPEGLPHWFEMFLTNVCEISDRNSPDGEPDAIVATLDELRNCALNAIEQCISYAAPARAAEGVRASETDDGRVISDEQKQQALRDGGASASSVRPFSIALSRIGAVPAMAAGAVAIPDGWKLVPIEPTVSMVVDGFESWPDPIFSTPEEWGAFEKMTGCQQATHKARICYSAMLAAAPQPAQTEVRVGLTDALRRAREELSIVEWENDPPSRVVKLFDEIDALLAARPGQPESRERPIAALNDEAREFLYGNIDTIRWAVELADATGNCSEARGLEAVEYQIRRLFSGNPEPRAEASPDDQRDVVRWRALMKNGEPEVFLERTQRRAIQRTQPVAFSSPNLTGSDRLDIPSEMWVKRYVMFAWWARENEHRKFIEAVDAIAAGTIK